MSQSDGKWSDVESDEEVIEAVACSVYSLTDKQKLEALISPVEISRDVVAHVPRVISSCKGSRYT